MEKIVLELDSCARKELEDIRDTDSKAYMRERASALLQIADGKSGRWVAFNGLLKPRRKNTIYDWVNAYRSEGIEGLIIKSGRGRKASFFPSKQSTGKSKS